MPDEVNQIGQEELVEAQPEVEETTEELSTSEQPTEETQEQIEGELPEDAKERTRREFEKLKQSNAELKRQLELKERAQMPSVLDFLESSRQPVPQEVRQQYQQPMQMPQQMYQQPVQQPPQQREELVDENGFVNADVLQKQLKQAEEANRRAEEAERRAQEIEARVSRYEINQEQEKLYQAYPELDPQSDSFNPDAYQLVKNELMSQIINTGNRNSMEAAQRMSKYFRTQPQQQAKQQQVLEQRKQALVSGTQSRPQSDPDLINRRDPDAIQQRLKNLGL